VFRSRRNNRRKPSARQKRLERREVVGRIVRRLGIVICFVALAAGLPALIFYGYSYLMESDYFALTYVDVEGLNYLEEEALLQAAEAVAGEHILDVRPGELESTMRTLPFVADVAVERRFPDRLFITIEEYEPEAIVVDEGFWLADATGEVFLALDASVPDEELWNLPLISGLSRAELLGEEAKKRLRTALEVHRLYHEMGLDEQYPVSEVHLDELLGLSLVVGETGTEIRLGWGRWDERLERLVVIQDSLIRRGVNATYVLIDHESDLSRVAVGRRAEPGNGDAQAPQ
jgi:cell division protein FtsQ